MTALEEMIAKHPFLAGTKPDFLQVFYECATFERHGTGEIIFQEGEHAEHFYLIHAGHVSLETFVAGSGKLVIQTLDPGEALGWSWLFPPYTWHFTARALEPAELIALGANYLRDKADESPVFGRELVMRVSKILLQRLQATRLQLLDFYAPTL